MKMKLRKINKYDLGLIFLAILSIGIKIFLSYNTKGPVVFGDELIYKKLAEGIFNGEKYSTYQYPPIYPLILSIAFKFKEYFYQAMIMINILLTTAMMVPVSLIAREFLSKKESLMIVAIILVMPFQIIYPRLIMSENIYYLIFLFMIYFFIKTYKSCQKRWCIFLGISIALGCLTKYLNIVVLIPMIIFWLNEHRKSKIELKVTIKKFSIIMVAGVICYLPWFYLGLQNGWELKNIIGLGISSNSTPENKNIYDFIKWIFFYGFYFILMIGPFIGVFIRKLIELKKCRKQEMAFLKLIYFISGVSIFVAIRHSWMAYYNYPTPFYIIGRYILFIGALWIIASMILIKHEDGQESKKINLISLVITSLLIIVSFYALILGKVFKTTNHFIIHFNAIDVVNYKYLGWKLVIGAILINIILLLIKKNSRKSLVFGLLVFVYYLCSSISIYMNFSNSQNGNASHGCEMSQIIIEHFSKVENVGVFLDTNKISATGLKNSLDFWGRSITIENKMSPFESDGLLLTEAKYDNRLLHKYVVNNTEYRVYKLPFELKDEIKKIEVKQTYPNSITIGRSFNKQPSGESAIVVKGKNFDSNCNIYINGIALTTTFGSEEFLSGIMPEELFDKKGELKLYIMSDKFGVKPNKSNEVFITVD